MKKTNDKTDAELVALTLRNPDYFAELVNRYEKKLFRYVRRLGALANEGVEDILQDSFLKIYMNLNGFDPELPFSSWAYRITHNEAISYMRKSKGAQTVPLQSDDDDSADLIKILESEIDVAKDASRNDSIERVRIAIRLLPEKYREVLILRYMEDLNYSEISDILKMPMGTVATLVNRAKNKFKEIAKRKKLDELINTP